MNNIIVIGLGISGLSFLKYLKRNSIHNVDVVALEEDRDVGYPEHCTGVVSEKILKLHSEAYKCILGKYRRIVILNEKFRELCELNFRENIYMIDRAKLDREIFYKVCNDFNIVLNSKVIDIERNFKKSIKIILKDRTISLTQNDLVVVCEGSRRFLYRKLVGHSVRDKYVIGIQFDCKIGVDFKDSDTIFIIYSHKLAPGYFVWIVPCGDFYRVGLGSVSDIRSRMFKIMKLLNVYKIYKIFGGKILLGCNVELYSIDNIVFLGDAACQIKPLTGGGNVLSSISAMLLSYCVKYFESSLDCSRVYNYLCNMFYGCLIRRSSIIRDFVYNEYVQKIFSRFSTVFKLCLECPDFDIQYRYLESPSVRLSSNLHKIFQFFKKSRSLTFTKP